MHCIGHASCDPVPTRGTWACPISAKEPHTRPLALFKNEAAAHCPLFPTSVSLTAPTNLRRSLRNVVGTHRVPGSWTTRVLAGSLRAGSMLDSPLPNQPTRLACQKASWANPADSELLRWLSVDSFMGVRTWQAALFAPRMENRSGESPWPTVASGRGCPISCMHASICPGRVPAH